MTILVGNWDRPCTKCDRTPEDGAIFRASRRSEKGLIRRSSCIDCHSEEAKERYERGRHSDSWELGGDWSRPCLRCGRLGNEQDFNVGTKQHGKLYRKSYCRSCVVELSAEHDKKNPEQVQARQKRHQAQRDWTVERILRWKKNPDEMRRTIKRRNVRSKFGISLEDYEFRFELQGGFCKICDDVISLDKDDPNARTAHLDHDHETGEIRFFLCDRCNVMIGMARERIDVLYAGINYLEMYLADR